MRGCLVVAVITLALAADVRAAGAAGPLIRPALDAKQREAVLTLLNAVDLAQGADQPSSPTLTWEHHVFKSADRLAYVPFRIGMSEGFKSTVMYVRVVSRREGRLAAEERSHFREWLIRGGGQPPRPAETVYISAGEMPVGLAVGSRRESVSAPGAASAALALLERQREKQRAAEADAKKKRETNERDPFVFPFEEYYFLDARAPATAGAPRSVERALALPPGEYDVFAALVDGARVKTSSPLIVRRAITVQDFWNDRLALSTLVLSRDVHELTTPLAGQQQIEHPYAFGRAEITPVAAPAFAANDVLTVVYQVCNYGAPDADLSAEYTFYRVDGPRRIFNRTPPQEFSDENLPPAPSWATQAFAMQVVPLGQFPAGSYELEVRVTDRVTRGSATGTVAFSVGSGVR